MGKIILRIFCIFSLAFNVTSLIYLLNKSGRSEKPTKLTCISPENQAQMRRVREKLQPQYARLQNRLIDAQKNLLAALRTDPIDSKEIDIHMNSINAIQLEWQKLTVSEILQCKQFLSTHNSQCLLNRLGTFMRGSGGCMDSKGCPSKTVSEGK